MPCFNASRQIKATSASECRASGAAEAIGIARIRQRFGAHGREAPDVCAEGAGLATRLACGALDGGLKLNAIVDAIGAAVARDARDQEACGTRQACGARDVRTGVLDRRLLSMFTHLDQHLRLQVAIQSDLPTTPNIQGAKGLVRLHLLHHLRVLLLLTQESVMNLDVLLRLNCNLARDVGGSTQLLCGRRRARRRQGEDEADGNCGPGLHCSNAGAGSERCEGAGR
mmetsp:Transcript_62692/g.141327  ORF Transcript_62692/g.141327 Transcript_62692/m.141327 type:complete len:227 (-) Transcript_62692:30-710(-)